MKSLIRMIIFTLLTLVTLILIFAGIVLAFSPGKPKPFMESDGTPMSQSLSEKTFLTVGGVRQGMFIQSKDTANPVLLYLHGGMPDYFLSKKYPTGLEDIFTVVWWEQRGSGISFNNNIIPSVTLENILNDALEITDYLRKRFGKEKIYIMGHSGGTFLGILLASKAPERYNAYIGAAQMSNQFRSEKMAYEYMINQYNKKRNNIMVRKLKSAAITDSIPGGYYRLRDKAMHELGIGTMRNMKSVITGIFFPSLFCRDYSFDEKVRMWQAKAKSGVSSIWNDMLTVNLGDTIKRFEIPVYFCCGVYDYTVNYTLSKDYFDQIEAPAKGFYSFEHSAHSPMFEEPDKFKSIMEKVIRPDWVAYGATIK